MPPRTPPPPPRHAAPPPAPRRARGKYGRRPADPSRPAVRLADVLTGTVPAHPASADYLAALHGGWKMLGNNAAGDCNAVTWANMRRLVTATLSTENYPDQAQVWEFYKTQNPDFNPDGTADTNGPGSPADQGMSVQLGLEYLLAHGGPDGVKPVAFARVNPADTAEVDAALAIFGCLWLGIQVLDANQEQFADGQPWTDVPGSPVDGGHAILGGGYTPGVKFITWGQEADFTGDFWDGTADGEPLVQEAWAVIWPEHLGQKEFLAGVSKEALAAAYRDVTGRELQLPGGGTPPSPEPSAPSAPEPKSGAPVPATTPEPAEDTKLSPPPDVSPPPRDPAPEAVPATRAASTAEPVPATLPDPGRKENGEPPEPVPGTLPDPARAGGEAPEPAGPTPPPQTGTGISPSPAVSPPQRAPVRQDAGLRGELEDILGRLRGTADEDLHQVVGFLRAHRFGGAP